MQQVNYFTASIFSSIVFLTASTTASELIVAPVTASIFPPFFLRKISPALSPAN
jgi:hypothetical protein